MKNIISLLEEATKILDEKRSAEIGITVSVKCDNLELDVCKSVSGDDYYVSGYFRPEVSDERPC